MPEKRGMWLIAAVVIIAVVLGSFWYLRRPERITETAVHKAGQATSHNFSTTLVLENNEQTQNILGEEANISLELDGAYTRPADEAARIRANINMSIASESLTVQLTGETRLINDTTYVYITKAPAVFPVLQQLKGQWIELPRGQNPSPERTADQADLFTEVKYVKGEKVAGVSTNVYQAKASQAAVVGFMDTIANLLGTTLTDQQIAQLQASTQTVSEVPVELWITPLNTELHQLKATLTVPGGNTVDTIVTLSDRNEPVDIEPPENPVSLQQAVEQLQ